MVIMISAELAINPLIKKCDILSDPNCMVNTDEPNFELFLT